MTARRAMVPGRGLEPLQTAPKTAVLPIRRPRIATHTVPPESLVSATVARSRESLGQKSTGLRERDHAFTAVASGALWVRSSRSAASACVRRSTRRCCAVRGTSVANSAAFYIRSTVRATRTTAPSPMRSTRASSRSPSTNQVAPLPASVGVMPVRSAIASLHRSS